LERTCPYPALFYDSDDTVILSITRVAKGTGENAGMTVDEGIVVRHLVTQFFWIQSGDTAVCPSMVGNFMACISHLLQLFPGGTGLPQGCGRIGYGPAIYPKGTSEAKFLHPGGNQSGMFD